MIPKILQALDAGLRPRTKEFHQALGTEASQRGLMPSDELPPIISGLRDKFSREAKQLAKEQALMDEVGIGILKEIGQQTAQLKVKQDFARANAPTYAEAEQYGLGLKPPMTIPSQQEALGPGAPIPFQPQGMSTEPLAGIPQELNPYTMEPTRQFNPRTNEIVSRGKLTAPSLEPAMVEGPRPMGTVYGPDMQAKVSPFEQGLVDDITQGRGVMQNGTYTPMQLAKPYHGDMSPEDFKLGLKQLEETHQLPEGVALESISIPDKPIPRQEGLQFINNLMIRARMENTDRSTLNRVAQSAPWGLQSYSAATPQQKQQILTRYGQLYPQGRNDVMLNTPVDPVLGETLYDRKAFEATGEMIPRPDVTNRQARTKDVVRISEKNMDTLQEVEKSAISLDQIFDFADQIITAKTPGEALMQSGKYLANSNVVTRAVPGVYDETMATYYDSVQALGNGLAKAFGGERGVLTNVDVTRWVNAMPKPGDTIDVKEKKKAALKTLAQAAYIAQRRAIVGDMGEVKKIRDELHKTLNNVLKSIDGSGTSQQKSKKSPDARYNELSKGGMKDEQIYKKMAEEGY
jgi:hypothetical protein